MRTKPKSKFEDLAPSGKLHRFKTDPSSVPSWYDPVPDQLALNQKAYESQRKMKALKAQKQASRSNPEKIEIKKPKVLLGEQMAFALQTWYIGFIIPKEEYTE
jgi:hypothetical protein